MDFAYLGQLLVSGIMLGLIYSLSALGFTLIYGIARIVNFAHGDVYMVGAFLTYYLVAAARLPTALGIIVSGLLMAGLGLVLERGLFRIVRPKEVGTAAEFPSVIIALALTLILPATVVIIFGTLEKSVPSLVDGVLTLADVTLSKERLVIMIVGLLLFICLLLFVSKHREGRALSAAAQDSEAALLMGVSLDRAAMLSFGIGFGLAGMSGALLAPLYFVEPTIGPPVLLRTFIVVIVGGIGSVPGTLLGGLVLGFIESFGRAFFGKSLPMLFAFILVMLVLVIRPRGLLGHD